jgi:hypothetical protein
VVDWATEVDNDRRLGLVAIAADSGQLIAHAGVERDPRQPDRAEFAVVIADPYQGRAGQDPARPARGGGAADRDSLVDR